MGVWEELGIAPTTDADAIRKAYAARLKAIDSDEEPEAFIALRAAFEQARSQARADAPVPVEPSMPTSPDSDRHIAEIEALLARKAPAEALGAAVGRLLASPDLDLIDRRMAIEARLAVLAASNMPASDPLLGPAIEHFGWVRLARRWDTPPAVLRVLDRHRDRRFLDRHALPPGSDHHDAFVVLRAGPPERRWRQDYAQLSDVSYLLKRIIETHHSVELDIGTETFRAWLQLLAKRRKAIERWRWRKGATRIAMAMLAIFIGLFVALFVYAYATANGT